MAIEFFDSISSTNDYFKDKSAFSTLSYGDAVVAFSQMKGRGRDNRAFSSGIGGIYFSISYGKVDNKNIENYYSLMPSAALCLKQEFKKALNIDTLIKWPNDILKDGKKCVGILAERTQKGDLILGVGVNYDNVKFCEDLENIATSLYTNGERPPLSKKEFAIKLIDALKNVKLFKGNPYVLEEYNASCITLGTEIEVSTTNGKLLQKGIAENVDENGALLLSLSDGSTYKCASGEVHLSKTAKMS